MTDVTRPSPLSMLPPIGRPDGRLYHPRKITAEAVGDADDNVESVVIFGTHDPERAHEHAQRAAMWFVESGYEAVFDRRVWWRDGFENGRRMFVTDEVKGRAACLFDVVEKGSQRAGESRD